MSVQGNLGFLACPSRSEVVLRTVGPYLTQVLSRQSSALMWWTLCPVPSCL
jgi:hypothetical protein